MSARLRFSATVLGLAVSAGVIAQERGSDTVYRCGAEGRQYSDAACPDGKPVAAGDARSADQRRQAEAVARQERELAERLTKERELRERNAPGAVGIGTSGPTAVKTAAATGPKKSPRKKKQKKGPRAPKHA